MEPTSTSGMGSTYVPVSVFLSLPIIVKRAVLVYSRVSLSAVLLIPSSVF